MDVVDDRLHRPGKWRIRAPLADVVAGLDQVPEMVDHTGAREERALGVDGDAPRVARSLAPDFEDARPGVNPEDGAREMVSLAVFGHDAAGIEHAVPAVQPAVGAPGERIGELVSVAAAEARRDDLPGVGPAVAIAILQEKNIGRLPTQTPPCPTAIPDGILSPSANTVNLSARPSPSVSSITLIRSRPGPEERRGYSMLSVIQIRPLSSNVMATGLTISGSAATTSTVNPGGLSSPGPHRPPIAAGLAAGPGRAARGPQPALCPAPERPVETGDPPFAQKGDSQKHKHFLKARP